MRRKSEGGKEIPIKFAGEGEERESRPPAANGGAGDDGEPSAGLEVFEVTEAGGDSLRGGETEPRMSDVTVPSVGEGAEDKELTVAGLLGDIAELTQALTDSRDQIEALMREKSTLLDQMLRRQAELENSRKRLEREKSEYYQRMRADILLELLPVLDNFDRALASLEISEGDAAALKHGVELIHKQLRGALTKLGLRPVEAVGQAFDPNLHEAVTVEATDEHEENTVIEEIERGYKLGDRLLRPAKVKVAASPQR
ncbi:MAG TPA: nucleotide exchange factor GrpE [Blastocatellia bacterium]|nr:nucleotide exchange factor GrpE [Blastocatellia bacterium]